MSQSQKNLRAAGRTDGQTLLAVAGGPKKKRKKKKKKKTAAGEKRLNCRSSWLF